MKAFRYHAPSSAEQAVKLLGAKAQPLAGGTQLLNLMKDRVLEPDVVVNLKAIRGLDRIEPTGEGLKIGANVTITSLLEYGALIARFPALAQALETMGSPQIRNVATLGGNLCVRTPCSYYGREGFACLKRGNGPDCPAKEGENEHHAIFATNHACVSVHGSGAAPALVALDASVGIVGPDGSRELPIEQFFVLSLGDPQRENVLAPDEIVTCVTVPREVPTSATYVVRPGAQDWPVAIASVALNMKGGRCEGARICLGAVAPIPWRSEAAEEALAGKRIDEDAASRAADAAVAGAAPLSQNAYKVRIARTAVQRAILLAAKV